jgi:hypothetical protein
VGFYIYYLDIRAQNDIYLRYSLFEILVSIEESASACGDSSDCSSHKNDMASERAVLEVYM